MKLAEIEDIEEVFMDWPTWYANAVVCVQPSGPGKDAAERLRQRVLECDEFQMGERIILEDRDGHEAEFNSAGQSEV